MPQAELERLPPGGFAASVTRSSVFSLLNALYKDDHGGADAAAAAALQQRSLVMLGKLTHLVDSTSGVFCMRWFSVLAAIRCSAVQ